MQANVLVKTDLTCCLSDFGLASVAQTQGAISNSTAGVKGSMRWMSAELLNPSAFDREYCGMTKPSDIYALACTALEVSICYIQHLLVRDDFVRFLLGTRHFMST
jgi:serine/threonine protein kinase